MNLSRFLGSTPKADEASVADPHALRGEQDRIAQAVANFLSRTGLFDRDAYLRAYPDVAKSGLDPLHHFVRVGIHAGRQFTSLETIARLWREVLRSQETTSERVSSLSDSSRDRVALYVSSLGNFFMTEIALVLKAGFDDAGVRAVVRDEKAAPERDATHHIVIAPHEFFVLGEGKRWATEEFVSRAILFSTEQIQTQWFARSLIFLMRAKAVADMNGQTAAILRKAGVRAAGVSPGYSAAFTSFSAQAVLPASPVFASLPPAARHFDAATRPFAERPLDVLFLGQHSRRREKLLAGYANKFAGLNTFIYYSRASAPLAAEHNPMASSGVTAALFQRAKVALNLHRDDYAYFEWWRMMQAFWNKCAVVSEPCFPHPLFKPGVHYFEEAPRHIHHLAEWLARAPEGQAKAQEVSDRAFRDLSTSATAKAAALSLLRLGEAQ